MRIFGDGAQGAADGKMIAETAEGRRLAEARAGAPWRRWGPYLSERQWGTVREDYSADGDAWAHFPHDHTRSRAYRWGEDGIAGFGDEHLFLCLALALWNERDAILKERLFGLTNAEGNHGEDVKEVYCYLDGTPTHCYMRMLYRYPQAAFPYAALIEKNRQRTVREAEFELADTGVFDDGRYFDVVIEYAKAGIDDILMQVTAHNRGPAAAPLHLVPQLWARNTWSWQPNVARPLLAAEVAAAVAIAHPSLLPLRLMCDGAPELLFCDNDTNVHRLWGLDRAGFPKDAINDCIVGGDPAAVNPERCGTKAAHARSRRIPVGLRHPLDVEIPRAASLRVRRRRRPPLQRRLCRRRFGFAHLRRQFQLARADLDAAQLPDHRIAAALPQLLRRRVSRRMPDRLAASAQPDRGRE
jgi:hypothetical protein